MKLIYQIPCFNEEHFLPETIKSLPTKIDGIDKIEMLIINDGSTDNTLKIAKQLNVEHILDLPKHQGLAKAFILGLKYAVELGADIIVNTDADNQYFAGDTPRLIEPILKDNADMVIGVRDIKNIKHFSFVKKKLQKLGSWVVRKISNTDIKDVTSGFRAFSRKAAYKINVFSDYTYTLETIIQAEKANLKISQVPIRINEKSRDSKLYKSIFEYVFKSIITMIYIYILYNPIKFFFLSGSILFSAGLVLFLRFIYYFLKFFPEQSGHTQSLIVSIIFFTIASLFFVLGLFASLTSVNRRLMENYSYNILEIKDKIKQLEHESKKEE
ncbi:MAG: glycosyltransferase family 2 protein [Candidatus Helarchaeota archaeon]|nr:glycosyltransferase family 2 protein [Candidatus Helarchaeota archaeon]